MQLLCAGRSGAAEHGTAAVPLGPSSPCLTRHVPLQDVLSSKNATIKDLQLQLARVCKVRDRAGGFLGGGCGSGGANRTFCPCLVGAQ